MKTLAIISARGGSKGLPGKNIKSLNGFPLIYYTIHSARNTKEIDKVIVSTENKEIASISEKYGAEVPFLRPVELAQDSSTSIDVLLHAVNYFENLGKFYDLTVLLEPTSPLRKKDDLSNAIISFSDAIEKYDGIVSLGKIHLENPAITKVISNGYVKPFVDFKEIKRRQDYPDIYFPYGVIYAVKTEILKTNKTIYTDRSMPYFIERWQNYEIDDEFDFMCVEQILKYKEKEIL